MRTANSKAIGGEGLTERKFGIVGSGFVKGEIGRMFVVKRLVKFWRYTNVCALPDFYAQNL